MVEVPANGERANLLALGEGCRQPSDDATGDEGELGEGGELPDGQFMRSIRPVSPEEPAVGSQRLRATTFSESQNTTEKRQGSEV